MLIMINSIVVYLLLNSTSNALQIKELKMTEVSVETCFANLKVLSLSLNF